MIVAPKAISVDLEPMNYVKYVEMQLVSMKKYNKWKRIALKDHKSYHPSMINKIAAYWHGKDLLHIGLNICHWQAGRPCIVS